MKTDRGSMVEQGGVIFEDRGPNGWAVMGAGGLIGVALCIIALALWNLSAWAGPALLVLAGGQAILATLTGVARIVEARGRARAYRIGPRAQEDIKALWGEDCQRISGTD